MSDAARAGRVLIAADKFKGSLTAAQVAEHLTTGLRAAAGPGLHVTALPVADGGDGTVDAALAAGFERREVRVTGPLGEPVTAAYALRAGTAVVEMAEASGLRHLRGSFAPRTATTYGTGELLRAALDAGARTVVLGVGGSATTDGGAGALSALGARLLDATGTPVGPGGAALAGLATADLTGLDPRLRSTRLVLASDVDNPLTGPHGAAAVYGPQKGASAADVAVLDAALAHYAAVLDGGALAGAPGAGAAGGLGYGALAGLGAAFRPGIEVMLDVLGFPAALESAGLVITGEGSLDAQTLHGKAPAGVAAAARARGVPVIAVCGRLSLSAEALRTAGFRRAYALTDLEPDPARCMTLAGPLLERLAERIVVDGLRISPSGA
ncbi:glycerate kinase [Streptomyces eurocidicus]|uniref:Glycerate kinase n=1 Tax=Streptomyces eurocidicus TaxID=66423 RepID=A0A2N8NV05_STREU|nr:glycerate kinase [Streptomyces eurocidicus]MBB5122635.1 glycerate kinase [Streptomyces eurocidicus]MBF6054715.1 glycerate kinase [Streptomyces eurocidicus]PNE32591.1 glycerate kinase [Streptomyces eurocidicus]